MAKWIAKSRNKATGLHLVTSFSVTFRPIPVCIRMKNQKFGQQENKSQYAYENTNLALQRMVRSGPCEHGQPSPASFSTPPTEIEIYSVTFSRLLSGTFCPRGHGHPFRSRFGDLDGHQLSVHRPGVHLSLWNTIHRGGR